jgi:lipoate-protein ligase A
MGSRPVQLVRDSLPDRPALDTAVSRAILLRVAAGDLPETIRVARPGAMVAFGKQDVSASGYATAVHAARGGGFEAVERLAGGRAAVFHEGTIAFAWAAADGDPLVHTHQRYGEIAEAMAAALVRLGVDARVGEVPREYCPGAYSVNARGCTKLAGIGQRVVRGAAHIGGVMVVEGGERVRDILVPVYEALGLDWDPETVGSVEEETSGTTFEDAELALVAELGERLDLSETTLAESTLALAHELEPSHLSPRMG